ncbi:MAG: cell division protein ZapE [Micrococcales bacterium]|nr:cell division protein ZapE [Micrococcales bacterium]MCL2667562.1 cell division protein ZapE [Micrococcales bacterium]
MHQAPGRLVDRVPHVPADRLVAQLEPPRHFATASFESYHADKAHPSQAAARARLREIAYQLVRPANRGLRGRLRKAVPPAVYLDGGFGVGKTHLLASLTHQVGDAETAYGTFVEFTHLVGALGFAPTVDALAKHRLVAIDEFELDDPGDTLLVTRLVRELADRGVGVAATSNTLPESLGEGRFAAEDFIREIQALADRFEVLRIDGKDYRHREVRTDEPPLPDEVVAATVADHHGATLDDFEALGDHLATVHPSRYGALLDGVTLVGLTAVGPVGDQARALRLVVLVDRLYDRDVPVLLGGTGEHDLFTPEMLRGGYRKKYFRALSRLGALAADGAALVATT